jgi:hypothetical protein
MSSFIYLLRTFIYVIVLLAVAWLVLWTIRDPKQSSWGWWPIKWWPFDTRSENVAAAEVEKRASLTLCRPRIARPMSGRGHERGSEPQPIGQWPA